LQNFTRWQFVFKVAIYLFFEFFSFEKKSKILKNLPDSILSLAGSQKYTMILDFLFFFRIFLLSQNPAKSSYG
jgi:hypothetical protein